MNDLRFVLKIMLPDHASMYKSLTFLFSFYAKLAGTHKSDVQYSLY